jgi:hypothetical protein
MSQSYLLRKALTTAETMLLPASSASYFFRSIYISNAHNAAIKVTLAVTSSRSFAAIGDWIIYEFSISSGSYLVLENILVPVGHQLRGYSDHDLVGSLVAFGVME